MTTELEKQFFDTFGIECNIHFHQQFNGAQVPRGLEFYKERKKLEKEGIIKIWHKMLNPRPENDCIYWGEYHYPQITDKQYLELICVLGYEEHFSIYSDGFPISVNMLKASVLDTLITGVEMSDCSIQEEKLKHQVQAIFNSNQ